MHFAPTRVLTVATGPSIICDKTTMIRMLAEDWLEQCDELDRIKGAAAAVVETNADPDWTPGA